MSLAAFIIFVIVPLTEAIETRGVPFAKWVLVLGSLFQIVAGILLMLGLLSRQRHSVSSSSRWPPPSCC